MSDNNEKIEQIKDEQIFKKKKLKKRIITIVVAAFVFFFVLGPMVAAPIIYENIFGGHITTYEPLEYKLDDFEGLHRERYEFKSDRDDTLVGYMYYSDKADLDNMTGTVIVVHGFGGGGQRNYMDITNYFAKNNFYVFAYDATGNDESEGNGIIGMPHGISDLNQAINFVENNEAFADTDNLYLFGHSWGAYCVSGVLTEHPEIKGVVAASGMNKPADIILQTGEKYAGKVSDLGLPFVLLYQRIRCGKWASISAMDGFENSDCPVIILQSKDDTTVSMDLGYDVYYDNFKDDERFDFHLYEDRGHDRITDSDAAKVYLDGFNEEFAKVVDGMSKEEIAEFKPGYLAEHLDRAAYSNMLDTELFDEIIEIFEAEAE